MTTINFFGFLVFLLPMMAVGYLVGRYALGPALQFPVSINRVSFVVLGSLVLMLASRGAYTAFALHGKHQAFDVAEFVISGYSYAVAQTLALIVGLRSCPRRKPIAIKGGLVVSEDGGLHIVEPQLVEKEYEREFDDP